MGSSPTAWIPSALGTSDFATWFNTDPAMGDMVMRYLVRCAVDARPEPCVDQPRHRRQLRVAGRLGLTPRWAGGAATTEREQQLITACLAAHVNKFGRHATISLQGRNARGESMRCLVAEALTYDVREGCFFGNLFNGEGVFVGYSGLLPLDSASSSVRMCAMEGQAPGTSVECPPMVNVGACNLSCALSLDLSSYASCSHNGKSYQPLTTNMRREDIYRCGDGVCQFTESCGSGNTPESCRADCGDCP